MNESQELESLEGLLNQLLQTLEIVIQSGEVISDDFMGMIANELNTTQSRINQLRNTVNSLMPESAIVPQGADLLWVLSGGNQNAFLNYLRTFPGQGFQELASNPTQLSQVIAYLQTYNPIDPYKGIAPDGIPNTQLESSNVSGMRYNPKTQKLLVKFHGKNNEPVYEYDSVPQQIFQILQHGNAFAKTKGKNQWGQWWPMKNPSIGAAVDQYLKKGGYSYRKLR